MDGRRVSAAPWGAAAVRSRSRVASPRPDAACPARRTTLVDSSRRPRIAVAPVARGARGAGRSRDSGEPCWPRFVHRHRVRGASATWGPISPESSGQVTVLGEVDPGEGVVSRIVDLHPGVPARHDLHPAHLRGDFAGRGGCLAGALRWGGHRNGLGKEEAPPERGFGRSLGSRGTMRAGGSSAGIRIPEGRLPRFPSEPRRRGQDAALIGDIAGKDLSPGGLRRSEPGPGRRRRRTRHPGRSRRPGAPPACPRRSPCPPFPR